MSLPEVMPWQRLRARPDGLEFRRQHPIGTYVLDFYCAAAGLAIEVDGEAHDRGDRPSRDAAHDAFLAARGLTTIRIAAAEVLSAPDATADAIVRAALPLHRLAGGPPPHASHGEDQNGAE